MLSTGETWRALPRKRLLALAHFGSTALWHPFSLDETDPAAGTLGTLAFSTGPHWKRPDDARIALAMLREADEVTLDVLRLFAEHHIMPSVERATGGPPRPPRPPAA